MNGCTLSACVLSHVPPSFSRSWLGPSFSHSWLGMSLLVSARAGLGDMGTHVYCTHACVGVSHVFSLEVLPTME